MSRFVVVLLVAALTVLTVCGQTASGQEDDRLGFVGKDVSKEFISDVLALKYQVGNNTKRINSLETHIKTNAATDAELQRIADANNITIQEQESLLADLQDAIDTLLQPLIEEVTAPFAGRLIETTLQNIFRIEEIAFGLGNLGRRLHEEESGRLLSPIAIETAKKCSEELAKIAAAILKNNATIYELEEAFNINEVDIAFLQSTVEQNEANIAALIATISGIREFLTNLWAQAALASQLLTGLQNSTTLPATLVINDFLNVGTTVAELSVNATGGVLTNTTLQASCPVGKTLLGGGCEIVLPDGVTLADIAPYIKDGPSGPVTFASLSFPLTNIEDYANNRVSCDVTVAAASSTSPDAAYWEGAPFPLTFRAEALCYDTPTEVFGGFFSPI